ncbi:MAG TPA: hypothetical protein VMU53_12190 [Candidatus Sulfotelmatobacter sp.]|nr:hypothetical protein [Candidatus Sulfotelmatobacter sp.]
MSEQDLFFRQVEKLANSTVLHSSESLRKLLRYLARHALEHPGTPLKEYQIATEEFGRPPDFDPAVDSMVRVQAGRLRTKLAEYYATEGQEDSVRVELPKGTYALSFHHRQTNGAPSPTVDTLAEAPSSRASRVLVSRWLLFTLAALSILSVTVLIATFLSGRTHPVARASAVPVAPASLQVFWKPFLRGPDEPWVVFSNAAFVGRPETGMRYYNAAHDSPDVIWDHYTGVGEVLAVHQLDQVFNQLHRSIRVKRGSLFSLDDVKNNDLIFVGSPSENLTLREIPGTHEFVFQRLDSGPRTGDLAVANVHPQTGESRFYLASPSSSPLTEDYAVVGFFPGLDPARSVMIIAGTTTFGTQGAVEYVCSPDTLTELLQRLSLSDSGELKPFEALLRVKITKGVPVETELVSIRKSPS